MTTEGPIHDPSSMDRQDRSEFFAQFGRAVRREREARGLTQTDIGGPLDLTRASVANIEAGRQHCSLHAAVVLARTLGVPLLSLLPPDAHGTEFESNNSQQRLLDSVSSRHRNDVALVLSSLSSRAGSTDT